MYFRWRYGYIENNYYIDETYLNLLRNSNQPYKKNISLLLNSRSRNIIVPENTTISQLYKALLFKYGLGFTFLNNGNTLTENDYRIVIDGETIVILEINNIESGFGRIYGKTINSKIINENSSDKEKRITFSAIIGTLNSFKHFIKSIEDQFHLKVKKFYFEKKK